MKKINELLRIDWNSGFLSRTAAVAFSPLACLGYNWMAQASASNAPSLRLGNQLSSLYSV